MLMTEVRIADDGRPGIDGELTIRGVTGPVTATGHYAPTRQPSFGPAAGANKARTGETLDGMRPRTLAPRSTREVR
jgi:polyisoprenoid-binding protein YceI